MRGKIKEIDTKQSLRLVRGSLSGSSSLELNKQVCNGCGVCIDVCPKEAISQIFGVVDNGVFVKKSSIKIDSEKCNFCGECVVLCPLKGLVMKVDGERTSFVEINKTFPSLLRAIEVSKEKVTVYEDCFSIESLHKTDHIELSKCSPECELRCQSECPTDSIEVVVKRSDSSGLEKTVDVKIDESKCIYCKRCELTCPFDAIRVKKPYYGRLTVDSSSCSKDCVVCQDICPTGAIRRINGNLVVSRDFCVFCSACEKVCPEKVISVKRDQIFCSDVESGAWLTALRKIVSSESFIKKAMVRATKKRFDAVDRVKDFLRWYK